MECSKITIDFQNYVFRRKNISENTKVNLVYGRLNVSPDDFLNEATLNVYEVASLDPIKSNLKSVFSDRSSNSRKKQER